ncbi:MAG: hypothetical protein GC146_04405 [Limimaricola sp.]|uniref:hypothetical protein n=1 Tax=Limimaricola sp. TaxID=2211665 RepID=UPI001E023B81|nr:hypothetical protein [Limimaricola sp.]MBI1416445.1 hypothetical protein [Limimaricola sp.]
MSEPRRSFWSVAHPFFRPAWRRAVAVIIVLGQAALEFSHKAGFWGVIFLAAGLYLLWAFFLAFDPADYERKEE